MIKGVTTESQSWKDLPWKKFQRQLFGLQVRVFKAAQRKDNKTVLNLQKLIARSQSARYLAIREVTKSNLLFSNDKKYHFTLRDSEFWELEKEIREEWITSRSNNFFKVSTKNSTNREKRQIVILKNKVLSYLNKFILDPVHEENFQTNRYKFQKEGSVQYSQQSLLHNLNTNKNLNNPSVLIINLGKFLRIVSKSSLMKKIVAPQKIKLTIFRYLKLIEKKQSSNSANFELDVLNKILENLYLKDIYPLSTDIVSVKNKVFIVSDVKRLQIIIAKIKNLLLDVGLSIDEIKPKIVLANNDFNFLDWEFRYDGKTKKYSCFPSKESFKKFQSKIKTIVNSASMKIDTRVMKLSSLFIKWQTYNRYCCMTTVRKSFWAIKRKAWTIFNSKSRNKLLASELVRKAFPNYTYTQKK